MDAPAKPNLSNDVLWRITRSQNAFLVKQSNGGGSQFSRDPLNLVNKPVRKHSGLANSSAIGVQTTGDKGALAVTTKTPRKWNKPAENTNTATYSTTKSNRKTYKGIANRAVNNASRSDLRGDAVARASALRNSQRPKKETPERKLRGVKARKAAEKGQ